MLKSLYIENYAIISRLSMEVDPGFNGITGETGAGKSILIGALQLVLGQRADTSVLLNKDKKCIVEAVFTAPASDFMDTLWIRYDLDAAPDIILRRELSAQGKSRSFINDTPVSLTAIKEIGSQLVDLHQQFDTLDIRTAGFQCHVLDALAHNTDLLRAYQRDYQQYSTLSKQLYEREADWDRINREADYTRFLLDELEAVQLKPDELEQTEEKLKRMENAEHIKQQLQLVSEALDEGEQPVVHRLKSLQQLVGQLLRHLPEAESLHQRMIQVGIELKDIAGEVQTLQHHVQFDSGDLEQLQNRLSEGYRLLKKHQVQTTAQLLEIQSSLAEKMIQFEQSDAHLDSLRAQVNTLNIQCEQQAALLSASRKKQVSEVVDRVHTLLDRVGMPNARLQVAVDPIPIGADGADRVQFLLDANKSGRFEPLAKVGSGGELSRLMLCIKSLVAAEMQMPTLIFDEIDTGISGEAARQVGHILQAFSQHHQVLLITHQPQIAARAHTHWYVYKQEQEGSIQTAIRKLRMDERIDTIASMMSGDRPTKTALANAREMIQHG
ncbi:MAG: DNA repair protein RecN [Ferruginibacter sp.]